MGCGMFYETSCGMGCGTFCFDKCFGHLTIFTITIHTNLHSTKLSYSVCRHSANSLNPLKISCWRYLGYHLNRIPCSGYDVSELRDIPEGCRDMSVLTMHETKTA